MTVPERLRHPARATCPAALTPALLLTTLVAGSASAQEPLRACLLDDDLPRASKAEGRGFDLDLLQLIADRLGRRLVPVWSPSAPAFAEIEDSDLPLDQVESGACDVAASVPGEAALADADGLRLTQPYYGAAFEVYGETPVSGLEDLAQLRVAVQLQTLGHYVINARSETWQARPTPGEAIALVDAGEADVALLWGPALAKLGKATQTGFEPHPALRFNEHFALRDDALRAQFEEALAALGHDGAIAELAARYGLTRAPWDSVSDRDALFDAGVGGGPRRFGTRER